MAHVPFICAELLWELVCQLSTLVNVELGQQDEGAMLRGVAHRERLRRRAATRYRDAKEAEGYIKLRRSPLWL